MTSNVNIRAPWKGYIFPWSFAHVCRGFPKRKGVLDFIPIYIERAEVVYMFTHTNVDTHIWTCTSLWLTVNKYRGYFFIHVLCQFHFEGGFAEMTYAAAVISWRKNFGLTVWWYSSNSLVINAVCKNLVQDSRPLFVMFLGFSNTQANRQEIERPVQG